MSINNYDLRKALYNYLSVKLDSDSYIDVINENKLKTIKVSEGSIVNMSISATTEEVVDGVSVYGVKNIYMSGLSKNKDNGFYSNFKTVVNWTSDNIIYVSNDSGETIKINSIHVEFIKGSLEETFLAVSTDTVTNIVVTVNDGNINRLNYGNESMTFKSEHQALVQSLEDFKQRYNTWKLTLGKFAYIDKLYNDLYPNISSDLKKGKIGDFIDVNSITNELIAVGTIERSKLSAGVETVLLKGETAVQEVYLNGSDTPLAKDVDNGVNVKALVKLSIEDYNNNKFRPYEVNSNGVIEINDWSSYMQPKLIGSSNDLLYFDTSNKLKNISKTSFVLKDDLLLSGLLTEDLSLNASNRWTWGVNALDDVTVPSSLLVKNTLDKKVDVITTTPITDGLKKITTNATGQVISSSPVSLANLTDIIGNYYLTKSYSWDPVNGTLKLL